MTFEDRFFADLYTEIQKNQNNYYGPMRDIAPQDYILFPAPYDNNKEVDNALLADKKKEFKGKYNLIPIAYRLKFSGNVEGHINLQYILKELKNLVPSNDFTLRPDEL